MSFSSPQRDVKGSESGSDDYVYVEYPDSDSPLSKSIGGTQRRICNSISSDTRRSRAQGPLTIKNDDSQRETQCLQPPSVFSSTYDFTKSFLCRETHIEQTAMKSDHRPAYIVLLCSIEPRAVYRYTPDLSISCPERPPGELDSWPVIYPSSGWSGIDKKGLKKDLGSYIDGPGATVTDEVLKQYELVLAHEDMEVNARMFFAELLGAISFRPGMIEKRECRKHAMAEFEKMVAESGVSGVRAINEGPLVFGYLVRIQKKQFLCFLAYGDIDH